MMECVSSISGILSGLLFVIPFLIVAFWWISLPAYYLLLVIELRSLCRVESSGGKTVWLVGIVIVQTILPLVSFLLYLHIPGSMRTSEPLGLDMKAYRGASMGIGLALCGFAVFYLVRWFIIRHFNSDFAKK